MKYKYIQIIYDQNGDVTEKLGKDVVTVLILPNAHVLGHFIYESENEEVFGEENYELSESIDELKE